jgi:Micrococcal nuclease (thermonuclease) homologs
MKYISTLNTLPSKLFDYYKENKFDRLIIGGLDQAAADFPDHLHTYLKERCLGTISTDVNTTKPDELVEVALDLLEAKGRESEKNLVEEFREKLPLGLAVDNLEATLKSLMMGQVRILLVSEGYKHQGYRCPESNFLVLEKRGDLCPEGKDPVPVTDIVDDAIEEALGQGAEVEVIHDEEEKEKNSRHRGNSQIQNMRYKRSKDSKAFAVLELFQKAGFFRRRKGLYLFITVILILVPLYFQTETGGGSGGGEYTVESVIDGDTVTLNGIDSSVRYLGIDAPEILTDESPGDPLSEEAKNFNRSLIDGKKLKLEFDQEKYDDYGRTLAYIFADDVFVNEEIVRNGLARVLVIKPNDKYASVIYEAQEQARRERRGIWGEFDTLKFPPENASFSIKPSQASRYIGQRVVVRGKITDFRKSAKVIVLNMEDVLDIVIFSNDWGNFTFFDITPEKYYIGKPVEVTGRVKIYKGSPQIIISHPVSIRGLS